MLNWSNRLVKYTLVLIIVFILSSAIGCAKGPAVGLELKPDDLGSDWAYKVKMGPTSYGGNPQFFLDGRNLCLNLNQVVVKDDARVIKSILQDVMVYPYVEEAVDRLKGLSVQVEPLDLQFWDEAFWFEQEA